MKILLFSLFFGIHASAAELIVWNVGQGLWATIATRNRCEHFDAGGEIAPWQMIEERCASAENIAYFSHWDWDHVSWAAKMRRRLKSLCIGAMPGGTRHERRSKLFEKISLCERRQHVKELTDSQGFRQSSNDSSRVFVAEKSVLLPGDATKTIERRLNTRALRSIRFLIAGHHGSKTSTSNDLLRRLPHLKIAIASARKEKYGHPHPSVVTRLKERGISLLKTEDWGSIHIELPQETNQRR